MTESSQFKRLIALAKLRTEGFSPLLRKLGCAPGNALTAFKDGRRPQKGLVESLSLSLKFGEGGFTDESVESWLARSPDDLASLVRDHGFEIRLIARYISDREREGRSHQYKFCLLWISYGVTSRFVMLRMTYDKLDAGLEQLKLNKGQEDPQLFSYQSQLRHLMEIDFALKKGVIPHFGAYEAQVAPRAENPENVASQVMKEIESFLEEKKNQKKDDSERGPSLLSAPDKIGLSLEIRRMIDDTYGVRPLLPGRRSRVNLRGVTNSGEEVEIQTAEVYPGETEEAIAPPATSTEQLVVTLVHSSGLVEVIYNGPTKSAYDGAANLSHDPSGRARFKDVMVATAKGVRPRRQITLEAIRKIAEQVPRQDRLKIRTDV